MKAKYKAKAMLKKKSKKKFLKTIAEIRNQAFMFCLFLLNLV